MIKSIIYIFFVTLALSTLSFAEDKKDKIETLDFEADVIEGQKKSPELFLQLDVQQLELNAVLYNRKSFNDFHSVDHKRRPWLSDPVFKK